MNTNKELLDSAAKAVGYEGTVTEYLNGHVEMGLSNHFNRRGSNVWMPLHSDDDALCLAVELDISVHQAPAFKEAHAEYYVAGRVLSKTAKVAYDGNKFKATRKAIVMAAADIGSNL